MATNKYLSNGRGIGATSERELLHSLMKECIQQLGMDVFFIPRKIANFDQLYGEDPTSYFDKNTVLEMYLESYDGFDGKDDYMSKWGLRTEEMAIFKVSRRRFDEVVGEAFARDLPNNIIRPNEGDLLYLPLDNNLFEIRHVGLKDSFYQLSDYYCYNLTCSLFQYSSEVIDTGVQEIQDQIPNSLDNLLYSFIGASDNVLVDATDAELNAINISTEPTNQLEYNSANKTLKTESDSILSFSEANPFGL